MIKRVLLFLVLHVGFSNSMQLTPEESQAGKRQTPTFRVAKNYDAEGRLIPGTRHVQGWFDGKFCQGLVHLEEDEARTLTGRRIKEIFLKVGNRYVSAVKERWVRWGDTKKCCPVGLALLYREFKRGVKSQLAPLSAEDEKEVRLYREQVSRQLAPTNCLVESSEPSSRILWQDRGDNNYGILLKDRAGKWHYWKLKYYRQNKQGVGEYILYMMEALGDKKGFCSFKGKRYLLTWDEDEIVLKKTESKRSGPLTTAYFEGRSVIAQEVEQHGRGRIV